MNWADYKKQITVLNQAEMDRIEIVAQLVKRRTQLGLTQQQLADKSGLKQAAIARLETENAVPRLDTLEKVSRALGLRVTLIEEDHFHHESTEMESV
ncbi:helix-turn-helix domain-containing protein [Sporosarcina limicola]|uniref:Transcriptional regulator with XRE-family HTH domain n=1 Tax=Sporosarcina limicola TaxID=34101 RepID=A0A927MQP8_9BACL|nr:helix-turn-helix transcriptional regulator [Sporosarcina limicola]MBE1557217.1 transcriptional regulator with XRE-family HTH domain [Sporosarcina limicola]